MTIFQNEDVDIGFQNYIATYNRNLYIAFLAPFTTETVGMMAPMPKKEAKWRSYIDTFGTSKFVIIDHINCTKLRQFLNDELLFQPSKPCIIKLR